MGSFRRVSSIRHQKKVAAVKMSLTPSPLQPPQPFNAGVATGKARKKPGITRLWMRFDWSGAKEVTQCEKSTIIKRASVSARDLRIVLSNSSKILAREKAIVVNLEGIKAIVTAEEVLLLDPLNPPVRTLIDRLKQQFPLRSAPEQASTNAQPCLGPEGEEGLKSGLPFEFQVLEIVLEVVCAFVDSNVSALETQAWSLLDELTKKVSTENLDSLRTLKSNISNLLARVHKVRDEIEHFLDDKEDMADLYLKRKWIQNQQTEAASNSIVSSSNLHRLTSKRSVSLVTEEDEVEDLEMLLEAYFMQLDGIRNKILMMKEHIDSTEDYVKILQNGLRNGLINLMMIVEIANFAVTASNLVVNLFGMNIPMPLYDTPGIFNYFVMGVVALGIVLFTVTLAYLKRKKLLD